ncbi:MAG: 2-oxo acid dehydrogenase subunit E2 [Acidimicrobiia bacterium]|nr:2-oxo acid dehydrogenase subunit E2 [Acidimicrobiia bacterium]
MHTFKLPDIGEGLVEAEIVSWLVAEGDPVGLDEPLVEVETDKTVVVMPAPVAGIVVRHGAEAGETVAVGAVLAVIDDGSGSFENDDAGSTPSETDDLPEHREEDPPLVGSFGKGSTILGPRTEGSGESGNPVLALPLVRKLARDQGVDLAALTGTGPNGRITRADIMGAVEQKADMAVPASAPHQLSQVVAAGSDSEVVPMTKLRRTIADRMSRSWAEIPRVTTFDDVDATRLLQARKALSLRHGQNVTLEALVVKAVVPVLGEFPEFNATVSGDEIILHRRYHIAVAVDTPNGLMVPVVHNAGELTVLEIAGEIMRLSAGASDRSLVADDLSGGTFTVSNIGAVGGGHGTPIVPLGTTAILSVGRARDSAVVRGEAVVVAPMMPLSLSYDHRVIDGALGRKFMARLMENLAEPALFLV